MPWAWVLGAVAAAGPLPTLPVYVSPSREPVATVSACTCESCLHNPSPVILSLTFLVCLGYGLLAGILECQQVSWEAHTPITTLYMWLLVDIVWL